jgi:peptidoglycan/LPS O-acetylase OafA/YrhL
MLRLSAHVSGTSGGGSLDWGVGDYVHLGVAAFFVVSGFLITHLLLF